MSGEPGGDPSVPPPEYPGATQEKWDKYYDYIRTVEGEQSRPNRHFQERVGSFAGSFSAHGFGRIYDSARWTRRILWVIVCIVLLSLGTYQCYRVVVEYFSYPKKVTISVEEEPVAEFPALTVCNLNPLPNKEKLRDHPKWGTFIQIEESYSDLVCDMDFGTFDYEYEYGYNYEYSGDSYSGDEYWDPENEWSPDGYFYDTSEDPLSEATTESMSSPNSVDSTTQATPVDSSQASDVESSTQATTGDSSQAPSADSTTGGTNSATTEASQSSSDESTAQATPGNQATESTTEMADTSESTTEASLRRKRRDISQGRLKHLFKARYLKHRRQHQGKLKKKPKETQSRKDKKSRKCVEDDLRQITGAENVLPKPIPDTDFFLDFDSFTKRNRHLFLETPPAKHRIKRSETTEKLTGKDVDEIRLKCSNYYKYLKFMLYEDSTEDNVVDFKDVAKCPEEDYKEEVSYNPLCQLEVFCDKYGCFDFYLNKYKETRTKDKDTGEMLRCPSCAKDYCWPAEYFTQWENGTLSFDMVLKIFNSSHTPDLSDVLGQYRPTKEDLKEYSIPPKDFIRTCSFDRRPCSYKLFYSWSSDQYGECHTFNSAYREVKLKSGKVINATARKTSSVGPRNGIRLTLSIKSSNYLTLLSPDMGAKVIVHSPRHIPFPEDEGFNISPGISVSVGVKKKRIERVGQPHGKCESKTDPHIKEYSSIQCKKLCQEKEYWRACGCYVGQSPAYSSISIGKPSTQCNPFNVTQKLCMATVGFSYQQGLFTCDCPPSCNETVYTSQVTSSEENKGFYTIVQNIKKADMGDDLCSGAENETVRLHLYLESLTYEVITESPAYTWDTLICNMGGNLGLFIGMSLVTLIEVIEFLIDLGLLCFASRKKTQPEAQKVQQVAEARAEARVAPPASAVSHGAEEKSMPPPVEQTDNSVQTRVTLQPFSTDEAWKRRAMGHKQADQAFNHIFMSQ